METRPLTQEEKAVNSETWNHINFVSKLLAGVQQELTRRQFTHDQSKLLPPEVEIFTEYTAKLRNSTYGSDEYKQNLKKMGKALDHHYAHNRHHPEFYLAQPLTKRQSEEIDKIENHISLMDYCDRNNLAIQPDDVYIYRNLKLYLEEKQNESKAFINHMTLIDLIEMLCDWVAAVERHADGDIEKSLTINQERFHISPQLQQILKNTAPWIKDEFKGLDTQQDLTP